MKATAGRPAPDDKPQRPPAAEVARAILKIFGPRVSATALRLRTPVPARIALASVGAPAAARGFLGRYEPRAEERGLYPHQAAVLEALSLGRVPNVVLTTATGSGKSLAFWCWLVGALSRDPETTGLACFPTQALLWGQAERLARASRPGSLVERGGQIFGGELEVPGAALPWTVWHGTSDSSGMKEHEGSELFRRARIRLTTLDKVHWSLMRERHARFLERLRGIVLDEAHLWHGLAGANVRGMLDRLRLSLEVLRGAAPSFFLASATLPGPREFAEALSGARRVPSWRSTMRGARRSRRWARRSSPPRSSAAARGGSSCATSSSCAPPPSRSAQRSSWGTGA